mmetsp:Transcript_64680/g.140898  ORF Transcript_64680/g.140898 Transcript_64680/m.140898 type:complete len:261 (+) Transcript_64680:29-811(+)|eukprot:CAMPEP_0170615516 /NCGR_PEP_ID=MMETSP0224-20130122/25379_1 /TAXON_ID=285029 /ORGANISM="Togula jolla, Strain CCCM 725" /LENGTH=260 /DNA_ID=CAMNT_0010941253 /DNA_START=16 /DNA_END=798 /DNA_ORIENTATION=+
MGGHVQDGKLQSELALRQAWDDKYARFSGRHMRNTFDVAAHARHDPFNKDPSWGKVLLSHIGKKCSERGVTLRDVFQQNNLKSDGSVNRAELKKVVAGAVSSIGDLEMAAIFALVDKNRSGQVDAKEFCEHVERACREPVDPVAAQRHRNPTFRVNRLPPSGIDGWDHLHVQPRAQKAPPPADPVKVHEDQMLQRLRTASTSFPQSSTPRRTHKYDTFMGGSDSARFRREDWRKERPISRGWPSLAATSPHRGDGLVASP